MATESDLKELNKQLIGLYKTRKQHSSDLEDAYLLKEDDEIQRLQEVGDLLYPAITELIEQILEAEKENPIKYTLKDIVLCDGFSGEAFDCILYKNDKPIAEVYYPDIDNETSISLLEYFDGRIVDETAEIEMMISSYETYGIQADDEYAEEGSSLIEFLWNKIRNDRVSEHKEYKSLHKIWKQTNQEGRQW